MTDFLSILAFPFFQRALLAGFVVGVLCAAFGVFVVLRKMSFFGEGVAHASLTGIAIGILANIEPLPVALVFAALLALGILFFTRFSRLASDTVIGVLFSASMAFGIVLIGFFRGYRPDLITYLFGNVLAVSPMDVSVTIVVGGLLILVILFLYPQLVYTTFDPDAATLSGIRTFFIDAVLHVLLSVVIVLSVKLVGIVLVAALLVIPAATSVLVNRTFLSAAFWALVFGVLSVFGGLAGSVVLNVASGAMIVLVAAVLFMVVFFGHRLLLSPVARKLGVISEALFKRIKRRAGVIQR